MASRNALIAALTAILESPAIYLAYQHLVGGIRARRVSIREHVRPVTGMTVLDIGCGPGYALQCFPNPQYFGFDISPQYIGHANRRFNPPGKFFCQYFDESALEWLPRVDAVLLMGVLHHLDDATATALLGLANRAMKPTGALYTLDGCYQQGQSTLDRFFLDKDRGEHIRTEPEYRKLASGVFQRVKATIRKDLFYIPQATLIMECSG